MAWTTTVRLYVPEKEMDEALWSMAKQEFYVEQNEEALEKENGICIFENSIEYGVTQLEEALKEKGIPFDRHSLEMEVSGQYEIRYVRPKNKIDFVQPLTNNDHAEPFITVTELEEILQSQEEFSESLEERIKNLIKKKKPTIKPLSLYV